MKADRSKLQLEMARACTSLCDLARAAEMPLQTLNKVIQEKNVRPDTIGKVAKALRCDPAALLKED